MILCWTSLEVEIVWKHVIFFQPCVVAQQLIHKLLLIEFLWVIHNFWDIGVPSDLKINILIRRIAWLVIIAWPVAVRRNTIALVSDKDITICLYSACGTVASSQETGAWFVSFIWTFHFIVSIEVLSAHYIIFKPSCVCPLISFSYRVTGSTELSCKFHAILERIVVSGS